MNVEAPSDYISSFPRDLFLRQQSRQQMRRVDDKLKISVAYLHIFSFTSSVLICKLAEAQQRLAFGDAVVGFYILFLTYCTWSILIFSMMLLIFCHLTLSCQMTESCPRSISRNDSVVHNRDHIPNILLKIYLNALQVICTSLKCPHVKW